MTLMRMLYYLLSVRSKTAINPKIPSAIPSKSLRTIDTTINPTIIMGRDLKNFVDCIGFIFIVLL